MKDAKFIFVAGSTALILSVILCADVFARELAVIANREYPMNSISVSVVKDIYLGEKTIDGNIKIRPMEQRDEAIRKMFIERVMGSTIDGYKAYWIKKFFQEGIMPPAAKGTSSEMIQAIMKTAGALGYAWIDDVRNEAGIKVLMKMEVGN
ncbi:MAG: hypothetical protein IT393_03165 [Nitrospirae bacterium]|nr:hypothetical protein [Nitrospirota bacterium]